MSEAALPRRIAELDRVIHEPARLAVLATLLGVEEADFTFLLRQTGLTRGNLSVHLTRLEQHGLVSMEKTFQGKRPRTVVRLTREGRKALEAYFRVFRDLLKHVPGED